ncbi:MAG: diaminopimelate epimerase [Firmicutes bacterium]|nr:diaminopimelate epimerase [Bacillota bacterium]
MHGLGNSYVYIDLVRQSEPRVDWPGLARRVSDSRFGIGSDGLILILPSSVADVRMRIFNADGSEAEMCGNGIRCVARYAVETGIAAADSVAVETGAGVLRVDIVRQDGEIAACRVDMGEPRWARAQIPMEGGEPSTAALDEPLVVDGREVRATAVSMGNPHCVLFVDDTGRAPVTDLGPRIEFHAAFPRRTNVEFVQVVDANTIKVRVWERGSGETAACGTGACAAAVAAARLGKVGRSVRVQLPGGALSVEWAADGRVFMTGECRFVCSGELAPEWLRDLSCG